MKLFKNKKGSVLVEKILMAAFAVAAGGATTVYMVNVVNESKSTSVVIEDTVNVNGIDYYTNEVEDYTDIKEGNLYSFTVDSHTAMYGSVPNINFVLTFSESFDCVPGNPFSDGGNVVSGNTTGSGYVRYQDGADFEAQLKCGDGITRRGFLDYSCDIQFKFVFQSVNKWYGDNTMEACLEEIAFFVHKIS